MNTAVAPNTQRGAPQSMIQPNSIGPIMPPVLRPMVPVEIEALPVNVPAPASVPPPMLMLGAVKFLVPAMVNVPLLTVTLPPTDPTPFRYGTMTVAAVYLLGLFVLPFAPETKGKPLPE